MKVVMRLETPAGVGVVAQLHVRAVKSVLVAVVSGERFLDGHGRGTELNPLESRVQLKALVAVHLGCDRTAAVGVLDVHCVVVDLVDGPVHSIGFPLATSRI